MLTMGIKCKGTCAKAVDALGFKYGKYAMGVPEPHVACSGFFETQGLF